ncbi:MAG: exodeoxyribonuclease VII small subunit [Deltaproteobacteria bacterium]|nr:exodeoxyribonuclease VII small subunit [Deltaproteobacteria bacterium]
MVTKTMTLKDILADEDISSKLSELSFEDGLKILDELVEKVESGTLALDKSILSYEKGVLLIEHLRKQLSGAEAKLKLLQRPASGKAE